MKRKIYDRLLAWKQLDQGRSAVLIQGARRVGKSYIVEEFAKSEYKSYILIDFNRASQQLKDLFIHDLDDMDTFFLKLKAVFNVELFPRESVIIFDEVQLFPRARSAIKYLVADGRYDYIETGSLISIKENVSGILIPSEEEQIQMYPMDFEEFLWAIGNETLLPLIRACFEKQTAMGQAVHRKAMDLFRQYMIVGGMPQAVEEFVRSRDFNAVDRIKRRSTVQRLRRAAFLAFGCDDRKQLLQFHRTLHRAPNEPGSDVAQMLYGRHRASGQPHVRRKRDSNGGSLQKADAGQVGSQYGNDDRKHCRPNAHSQWPPVVFLFKQRP